MLLDKDENKRPPVIDILKMPYVQQHMRLFVESQGKITHNPSLAKKQADSRVSELKAINVDDLTNHQKAKIHKE
jgi:hypothetical protein